MVEIHRLNTCRSTGMTKEISYFIADKLCLKLSYGMLIHMETICFEHIVCNAVPWSCVWLRT